MKYIFIFLFVCNANVSHSQKYVLLDKTMSQPAFYSNTISASEKFKGFFPVEKKDIPKFLSALEEIAKKLSLKKITGAPKNYVIGCTQFTSHAFPLASGERIDYVLTSTCADIKISMRLVDAKLNKENNAYFVNTWIKYIKNAVKRLHIIEK